MIKNFKNGYKILPLSLDLLLGATSMDRRKYSYWIFELANDVIGLTYLYIECYSQ